MSEDRYRVLQDAITKARSPVYAAWLEVDPERAGYNAAEAHLDTLQATLDRHSPYMNAPQRGCSVCGVSARYRRQATGEFGPVSESDWWPCPDVLTVETALRNMGALND